MRNALIIVILFVYGECLAATFKRDTIDNWQIYNGDKLILAGNANMKGSEIKIRLKNEDLKDIKIDYNHCTPKESTSVTIEITTKDNKKILTRDFILDGTTEAIIMKEELRPLINHRYLRIRYKENKTNRVNRILGEIIVE